MLVVAGTRPNFVKVAKLIPALERAGHKCCLVHTGQHYDWDLSETFFRELAISAPAYHLGVGTGTHAVQTARIMEQFEPVLAEWLPDWVVVVGDVNSTLACTLVAAKLRAELGCSIAHIEAGLRSHDREMPEEINRLVTDQLADLLLTPSHDARANLIREGIKEERIRFVGNVMIDVLYDQLSQAMQLNAAANFGLVRADYALATLHRPSNVDRPEALAVVLDGFARMAEQLPTVLSLHPRTRDRIERFGLGATLRRVRVVEPRPYREMLSLMESAAVVLTDSGGIQEETTILGVPCVTLRRVTERPVTIMQGTNVLVEWPMTPAGIVKTANRAMTSGRRGIGECSPAGWDGVASDRIAEELTRGKSR